MVQTLQSRIGASVPANEVKAGDIVTFNYYGGSDYGGERRCVKVLETKQTGFLGKIRPYGEGEFRNYNYGDAENVSIVGQFNPRAEAVPFQVAQERVFATLSHTVNDTTKQNIIKSMVLAQNATQLADQIHALHHDTCESVTFNDVTGEFELHPPKTLRFENGATICIVTPSEERIEIYAENDTISVAVHSMQDDVATVTYESPADFVRGLNELLESYL